MKRAPAPASWEGKRVLVTGGTGFIGSFVVERLLADGAKVRCPLRARNFRSLSDKRGEIEWMEGDLRSAEFCAQLLDGVDVLLHFASYRRTSAEHHKKCRDVLLRNLEMTSALVEALAGRSDVSVVFISTGNIPPQPLPVPEHGMPFDGYVWGKLACELAWTASAAQSGHPLLIVRPVGVYGPRDTFSEDGNIIPSLMVKCRDEDELVIWGSGKPERSFLYVEDMAGALFRLINAGAQGVQYLYGPHTISITDLAKRIVELVRPEVPIVYDDTQPESAPRANVGELHESLRDYPWTDFDDGLARTVESWGGAR